MTRSSMTKRLTTALAKTGKNCLTMLTSTYLRVREIVTDNNSQDKQDQFNQEANTLATPSTYMREEQTTVEVVKCYLTRRKIILSGQLDKDHHRDIKSRSCVDTYRTAIGRTASFCTSDYHSTATAETNAWGKAVLSCTRGIRATMNSEMLLTSYNKTCFYI